LALRRAWTKFSITKVFKKKEEVVVVAVLTIITSALLSGYGVYYFLSLRPAKVVKSQSLQKPSTVKNNSLTTATQLPKTNEENTLSSNELQTAQTVLENFFTYLANKQYEEAAALYGWGHDDDPGNNLQAWPGVNNAEALKNYCQSVGTCFKIKILTGAKTNDGEYTFMVQFLTDDGKIYEYSPVVDVEATTDFNFKVKKINNQFKVINPPLYHS